MTVSVIPITPAYRENWTRIFRRGGTAATAPGYQPGTLEGEIPSPATNTAHVLCVQGVTGSFRGDSSSNNTPHASDFEGLAAPSVAKRRQSCAPRGVALNMNPEGSVSVVVDYSKYANFTSFRPNPVALKYFLSESPVRAIFKGGQGGGTSMCAYDLTARLLGNHPVRKRNILNKPVRMVSKVVPEGPDDQQNQQYVELKRFITPMGMIKKDITARSKIMTVRDLRGGADKQVEFMASTQELDAFMSVQRSAYYQDEEIERIKWDESQIRLLREGGDSSISVTPAKGLDWMFDSIWKRARKIFRSVTISKKYGYPDVEDTGSTAGIECFCWATDDNPVMTKETIDRIMEGIDDPDEEALRRYGVFRQVSGRIYKSFDEKVHRQAFDKYFDACAFRTYWNYRIIDYHPSKPWAVSFVVINPHNEWFVWHELYQTHDNRTTLELRDEIKTESLLKEDEEMNRCSLIDPLSTVKQGNTGFSTFDDLSMGESGLRRLTPADTKNSQGRMNIKMRLKNALICGVPGNNIDKNYVDENRYGYYLPTLWILDNCKRHIEHFKNWRYVDWKQEHVKATRVVKRESEKFNDYCRNLEFLGALNPVYYDMAAERSNYWERSKLFQGQRAAHGWDDYTY
jgi:hypothetical protein